MSNQEILLLFDVHSLMNRAYYGMIGRKQLTAPDGFPTGALYAFLNMILKYREDLNPTHIVSAMDMPGDTFRHEKYDLYKAGRGPTPEDLTRQLPVARDLLEALGFQPVGLSSYEADDLIGTMARIGEEKGMRVYIVSGDRDTLQLVSDRTSVVLVTTQKTGSISETVSPESMLEEFGVSPRQWVDVKALMGDSSDNIPGVKGVGPKTAFQLIKTYGTLDNVYRHLDQQKGALLKNLEAGRESAYLSHELSSIRLDVPLPGADRLIDSEIERCFDGEALLSLLTRLDFRSLIERFELKQEDSPKVLPLECFVHGSVQELLEAAGQEKDLAFFLPASGRPGVLANSKACTGIDNPDDLFQLLQDNVGPFVTWDLKAQLRALGFRAPDRFVHDLMIASYLLNQLGRGDDMEYALRAILGDSFRTPPDGLPVQNGDVDQLRCLALQLPSARKKQLEAIRIRALDRLYQVETRLVGILADMELKGVLIDSEALDRASAKMAEELEELERSIYRDAGRPFNVNSPQQLAEVLYTDLKLPTGRKSSTGKYSTAADELERLKGYHPLINNILEYRELSKLRGTFLEGLKKEIAEDGRVHTSYNQTVVTTGRLSSSNPNLQNIPVRTERGSRIRELFIAPPGYVLVGADYSQIELRLLAHLSGDQELTRAFREGRDVHLVTASSFYGKDESLITAAERSVAITVNFSITYGISDFGLSRDQDISIQEARRLIERYHAKYPRVEAWLKEQGESAKTLGYVETLFHRRRYVPELQSQNRNTYNFGMRAAMNAPVQGTAADLIKIAMVDVHQAIRQEKLDAAIILQVHDELVLEVAEKDAVLAAKILKEKMEDAMKLSVPLLAGTKIGRTWGDLK
ncbi:MAG: DNA polymerase I [Clostridiaceae bacterium]|nr:DNA polymerase I [Clostridiaceae bacterium]